MRSGDCRVITCHLGTAAGFAEQENHLTKHDGKIATLQRDRDRILAKLDEILREFRGRR